MALSTLGILACFVGIEEYGVSEVRIPFLHRLYQGDLHRTMFSIRKLIFKMPMST
jgi:hypothetical protein